MSIQAVKCQVVEWVHSPKTFATSVKNTASRVSDYVKENKSTVFFACSVAFALLATPAGTMSQISFKFILGISVLAGCTLQAMTLLFGRKDASSPETQTKLNWLLGTMNIAARILSPQTGAAVSLFNLGVKATDLAYRAVCYIK